jgi:hypothetical protein
LWGAGKEQRMATVSLVAMTSSLLVGISEMGDVSKEVKEKGVMQKSWDCVQAVIEEAP